MEGNLEPRGSFSSSGSSSRRRRPFNSSGIAPNSFFDGEAEIEFVSEGGDIRDMAIHSGRSDSLIAEEVDCDAPLELVSQKLLQAIGFDC